MNEDFFLFSTKCFHYLKLLFKRRLFILNYDILVKAVPRTETFGLTLLSVENIMLLDQKESYSFSTPLCPTKYQIIARTCSF